MPRNHGSLPGNLPDRVDLKFANGWTPRGVDAREWRWSLKGEPGDIAEWQEARAA